MERRERHHVETEKQNLEDEKKKEIGEKASGIEAESQSHLEAMTYWNEWICLEMLGIMSCFQVSFRMNASYVLRTETPGYPGR